MKHAVQSFEVSKSLLLTTNGTVSKDLVGYCYRIKAQLKKSYKQWRISITPQGVDIKLQYKTGEIREYVVETHFPEAQDWIEILGYYVYDSPNLLVNEFAYA